MPVRYFKNGLWVFDPQTILAMSRLSIPVPTSMFSQAINVVGRLLPRASSILRVMAELTPRPCISA